MRLLNVAPKRLPEGARFASRNERDLRDALLGLAGLVAKLVKTEAARAELGNVLRLLDAPPPAEQEPVQAQIAREARAERERLAGNAAELVCGVPMPPDDPRVAHLEMMERAITGGAA